MSAGLAPPLSPFPERALILNRKFGPYVLLKRLAVGGMAELFLAAKVGPGPFDKLVVVKTILAHCNDDPDFVRLFYREAELGGRFSHPNVVHTYDCDLFEGTHYMVMEHMHGVTLAEMAERGAELGLPLPQEFAIRMCIDACEGLHYVHALRGDDALPLGVVHRDISPQNVFVTFDGQAKVFDFGIARLRGDDKDDPYKGMLAGKYAYMSPEQCRGTSLDGRSDIFSLGIILYELTTGYRLFKRDGQVQTLRAITEDEIPPPSELLDRYPRYLERIVLKALARDVSLRYGDALEFADDLRKFLKISGSKPTPQLLGAYVSKLFTAEIDAFAAFRRDALSQVASVHGRFDPVASLRARLPQPSMDLSAIDDDDELIPDEGPTEAAPGTLESPPPGIAAEVHVPERPTGPQRLATVEIAEGTQSGLFDVADVAHLQRARRANRILALVAAIAVAAALGAVLYFLLGRDDAAVQRSSATESVSTTEGTGTVYITSTPMGASIAINGGEREQKTPAELEVPYGQTLLIEVRHEGYKTYTKEVKLAEGQQRFRVEAKLRAGSDDEPVGPPRTAVRVVTVPPGARVVFDGQPAEGMTPLIIADVEVGIEHVLVIDADAHETLVYPFKVDDEAEVELQVELNPVDAAELGTLIIDSWPRGARVMLDERFAGRTPLPPLRLTAASYPLEVALAAYTPHAETVALEAGATVSLNPRLSGGEAEATPRDPETVENAATVDIETTPPTEVFIESESRGRTPLVGVPVLPGTVWIEFRDDEKGIRHVEVESFQPDEVRTLNVNIPKGRLVIEANKRAQVYLDGELLGHTPFDQEVFVGEHAVKLLVDDVAKTVQAPITKNKTFKINETF